MTLKLNINPPNKLLDPPTVQPSRPAESIPRTTFTYVESDHEPNIIVRIITLIIEIIKKIFSLFYFWKSDPYQLELKQFHAFKKIQLESYLKPSGPPPKNDFAHFKQLRLTLCNAHDPGSKKRLEKRNEYEAKDFPVSLQNMRRVLSVLVENIIDCLHEVKILPAIEHRIEYVEKASKMIKDLSNVIINMGFQLKVPIFDMLQKNPIHVSDNPLLHQSSITALNWLIENPNNPDYEKSVYIHLVLTFQEETIEKCLWDLETERCIEAVNRWVFNKERPLHFHDTYSRQNYPFKKVMLIYQRCLAFLIDIKLDALCKDLNSRLVEKLPTLIHLFLKTNSAAIIDNLSGRLADLISHIDMGHFIDDLTYVIYQQTKTYIEAQRQVAIDAEGKFKNKQKNLELEELYVKTCAKKFATLPETHPKLQQIVTIPLGKDPITWPVTGYTNWKESIEESFVTETCQMLLQILFPPKKMEIEGKIIEIDGITSLLDNIVIPDEIQNIFKEFESFVQRFLPENFTLAKDAKKMFHNMGNQFVTTITRIQLADFLSKKFFVLFKSLATPDQFSHLMTSYFGPVIEVQCIDLLTRASILNSLEYFNEHFHSLRETKKGINDLLVAIRNFIHVKLENFSKRGEELFPENRDHLDRLSLLISQDLEKFLFSLEPTEITLPFLSKALTTALFSGNLGIHQEIAQEAVVPYLIEINAFINLASERIASLKIIKKKLCEEFHRIFLEQAREFIKERGEIEKNIFINKIGIPLIQEFEDVLTHPDFAMDAPCIAIGKYLKGEIVEKEEKTNTYSEIILNLLFEIGEFGTITQYVLTSFGSHINNSIAKTLEKFKTDDYLLMGIISNALKEKFSTKQAILETFFLEDEKKEENVPDLHRRITRISAIIYDIFYQINVPARGIRGLFQSMVVTSFLGFNSSDLNNTIRRIYYRLFQDELLNANLIFKIKDIIAKAFGTASLAIKEENASYTGIRDLN